MKTRLLSSRFYLRQRISVGVDFYMRQQGRRIDSLKIYSFRVDFYLRERISVGVGFCMRQQGRRQLRVESRGEQSAKGAEYDSQGQARSEASASPLVKFPKRGQGLKGRHNRLRNHALSGLDANAEFVTRGDVLASLRTCPWLLYSAPLALLV